jgi:hypothetical protein
MVRRRFGTAGTPVQVGLLWDIAVACRAVMSEPGRHGPNEICRVTQLDKGMIAMEVAESFRVFGTADGMVLVFVLPFTGLCISGRGVAIPSRSP